MNIMALSNANFNVLIRTYEPYCTCQVSTVKGVSSKRAYWHKTFMACAQCPGMHIKASAMGNLSM